MPSQCDLWVNLASWGPRHRRRAEPISFLRFAGTDLLVGLPDEPGVLLDDIRPPVRIVLHSTDVRGLGLNEQDLARVDFCRVEDDGVGWQCTPVYVEISDALGELHPGPSQVVDA